jgi:hypothetical protein
MFFPHVRLGFSACRAVAGATHGSASGGPNNTTFFAKRNPPHKVNRYSGASSYQVCHLFSLSLRTSGLQVSGVVVMFFLITYQTAEATISDINFARQFSTKNRLIAFFMDIARESPMALRR